MDRVLTLIAGPAQPLDAALPARVAAALGVHTAPADWLAPGIACDLYFADMDLAAAQAAAAMALGDVPVDVVVQPAAGRRKRLLIADMDSTIVTGETLDELAALAGIGDRVAEITRRAMNGEIDFADALRARVAMLKGQPAGLLEAALARLQPMPGAKALVATMRAHGAHTVLVSGGFTFFTGRVRQMIGFDRDEGNRLLVADGCLTGAVAEPVQGREHKLKVLTGTAAALGIGLDGTLAVGDGANDLPMIQAAGLGVAFHAKPAVHAAASVRIDHADLTALLYLQGYRAGEIVG